MKAVVHDRYGPAGGAAARGRRAPGAEGRRGARPGPRHDGQPDRLRLRAGEAVLRPLLHRPPPAEAADPRHGARRRGRGRRLGGHRVRGRRRGLRRQRLGAHAEYVCIRESAALAHKPAGHELRGGGGGLRRRVHRAVLPAEGGPRRGRSILVYGASGSVGTAAVQLAKHFGADVTAVCNTKNLELVRSLGADEVFDYTREDFTKNGETYDVVFDAVGKHSFRRCRGSLKPGGIYIETDLGFCGTSRCWRC